MITHECNLWCTDQTPVGEVSNEVLEAGLFWTWGHKGWSWRRRTNASRSAIRLQGTPGIYLLAKMLRCAWIISEKNSCLHFLPRCNFETNHIHTPRLLQFAGGFDVDTMRAFQELKEKASMCRIQRQEQNRHLRRQQKLVARAWAPFYYPDVSYHFVVTIVRLLSCLFLLRNVLTRFITPVNNLCSRCHCSRLSFLSPPCSLSRALFLTSISSAWLGCD